MARTPHLIAFVNYNSGGKAGRDLAAELEKHLGKDNVFNLGDGGPNAGLQSIQGRNDCYVIVCGGDGTVSWVLSSIHRLKIQPAPPVAICPLGTGNDTSRHFGWGHKFAGLGYIKNFIPRVRKAKSAAFDRWHVTISHSGAIPDEIKQSYPPGLRPLSEDPLQSFFVRSDGAVERANSVSNLLANARNDEKVGASAAGAGAAAAGTSEQQAQAEVKSNSVAAAQATSGVIEVKASSAAVVLAPASPGSPGLEPAEVHWHADPAGSASAAAMSARAPAAAAASSSTVVDVAPKASSRYGIEFNNYLSFGFDAQSTYKYHHHRETNRSCYCCRCCNFTWFCCCSFWTWTCCQVKQLDLLIEVKRSSTSRWEALELPETPAAIVLLNIGTYAGGSKVWKPPKEAKNWANGGQQSSSDGLIEVIAAESPTHLSCMAGTCQTGTPLCQAAEVKIHSRIPVFVQMDGEPWHDTPAEFHIRAIGEPSTMLKRLTKKEEKALAKAAPKS